MSLGRTLAVALHGLTGTIVDVEAHVGAGLPYLGLSGLPDMACSQATDRIRSAAANSGVSLPSHRIVVNLSPASIPKRGTGFDLAIAMAVLSAAGIVANPRVRQVVHVGELGLDGRLRKIRGVLPMVVAAASAGAGAVVVPADNVAEAQLVRGIAIHAAHSLGELVGWYAQDALDGGGLPDPEPSGRDVDDTSNSSTKDLSDVVGQPEARVALELAAVGGHHLLLKGMPGLYP